MHKLLILLVVVLMLGCFSTAQAEVNVSMPMETTITGFYFPTDDTIAVGVNHTVLRVAHSALPKFSIDLDGTLAKEVNEAKDTLAGAGVKVNYHINRTTETGFVFMPSIGLTGLKNIKSFKDIAEDWKLAVYGSVILYKW